MGMVATLFFLISCAVCYTFYKFSHNIETGFIHDHDAYIQETT